MMNLGCSLCGWHDLNMYRSEKSFYNFIYKALKLSNLRLYEFPFLPQIQYTDDFYRIYSKYVFSIHASKHILEKSEEMIKEYFTLLKEYCALLNCKYVVIHIPKEINYPKIELAIECMNGIYLSIENICNKSFEIFNKYHSKCKMTIDIAHLLYHNQSDLVMQLSKKDISHFHIRGYCSCQKYSLLSNSNSKKVFDIINKINQYYDCPGILEYPYHSYNEMQIDIQYAKRYLGSVD